ncbi:hypothetical protein KJ359_001723 [Pestalotiopsis sp. 9143b]|nr:hypothetical protein KJ359_001723 [Pestalotiopsis sp. 9143b]
MVNDHLEGLGDLVRLGKKITVHIELVYKEEGQPSAGAKRRGKKQSAIEAHSGWVNSVAFSADGRRLASGSSDDSVKLWDAESGDCLQTFKHHFHHVGSVAFSADGRRLASGSNDDTVKLWDAESGDCLQTLEGHFLPISSVAFSADGRRLASGSSDDSVKLWDAESGDCLQTFKHHFHHVGSVAFSADGRRLASGSNDDTVKLWDAESGACIQTLNVSRALQYLSFDPDHHSRLLSDAGNIILDLSFMDSPPLTQGASSTDYNRTGYGISVDNLWITYEGHNLIWLPSEYRPLRSRVTGSMIAIGCNSGRVWVVRFAKMVG